mmetsp:Transcript_25941/g.65183  ORF Transcript_25941/g.65183 Transcript_25941/m.65183 type:complete len:239 (+) Transcript_25941:607-1323(+)
MRVRDVFRNHTAQQEGSCGDHGTSGITKVPHHRLSVAHDAGAKLSCLALNGKHHVHQCFGLIVLVQQGRIGCPIGKDENGNHFSHSHVFIVHIDLLKTDAVHRLDTRHRIRGCQRSSAECSAQHPTVQVALRVHGEISFPWREQRNLNHLCGSLEGHGHSGIFLHLHSLQREDKLLARHLEFDKLLFENIKVKAPRIEWIIIMMIGNEVYLKTDTGEKLDRIQRSWCGNNVPQERRKD